MQINGLKVLKICSSLPSLVTMKFIIIFNSKDIDSKRYFSNPSKVDFKAKSTLESRTRLLVDPTTHQVMALPFNGG